MVSEEEGKDGRVEEWERAIERLNGEPDGIYSGEYTESWVSLCSTQPTDSAGVRERNMHPFYRHGAPPARGVGIARGGRDFYRLRCQDLCGIPIAFAIRSFDLSARLRDFYRAPYPVA